MARGLLDMLILPTLKLWKLATQAAPGMYSPGHDWRQASTQHECVIAIQALYCQHFTNCLLKGLALHALP